MRLRLNKRHVCESQMWGQSLADTTLCTDVCVGVAVDRFANFGAFVAKVVGDGQSPVTASKVWPHSNTAYSVIMSMRVYAMYLGSKLVLGLVSGSQSQSSSLVHKAGSLVCFFFFFASLALLVCPCGRTDVESNPKATEWILSGIYVCGPNVDTSSSLPLAWHILAIVTHSLLFLLAAGRFLKHALDMRQMLHKWKVTDLMGVLVRDSIVYFFMSVCRWIGGCGRGLTVSV